MRRAATIANCEKMGRKKKHRIPPEAKMAILTILKENCRIPTDMMLDIVAAAVPFDKADKPLRAYWLDKCRKLMSSIRDEDGRRMVFNISKKNSVNRRSEYVLVGACSDHKELLSIEHRLRGDVTGLENSIQIISDKLTSMAEMRARIDHLMK